LVESAMDEYHRISNEVGVQFDLTQAHQQAAEWSRRYTFDLIKGLNDTTRTVLQDALSQFNATPGMTRAELEMLISPAFGEARAAIIASTEVTRASSQALNQCQEQLRAEGVEMSRRWLTAVDDLTCSICRPLNGLKEDQWANQFPDGPPAHPACRCSLSLSTI
jgi:hypothetical protein